MPNFWSSATQKIYEIFKGPSTKDIEFDLKVQQLKSSANKIETVRSIYENFHENTRGKKNLL
jgi:hypothetical protein